MEKATPVFSCVIPTNGRAKLIKELLSSLRAARLVNEQPLEIILVDDSSLPEAEEIQTLCQQFNAFYIAGTSSVRKKRNLGIENAHGEYVFFIDSDCVADEHVFERHYAVLTQTDYVACIGVTKFVGEDSYIWHVISNTRFLDSFRFPVLLKGKVDSAPWGPTTNLSVKRDVLTQLGGFETALPFALGADDADLGLRINEAGYRIGMAEEAFVYHSRETWSSWSKILRRVFRWGKMDYHLYYRRHVEKTAITMPKPITFFLLILMLQLVMSFGLSWLLLTLIILWPPAYLLFFSVIKRRHWKMKTVPLRVLMGAEYINQVFDFGCMLMSLRHFNFRFLFSEPVDDPRAIWHTKIHTVWASCLASFCVILIDGIWMVFQ